MSNNSCNINYILNIIICALFLNIGNAQSFKAEKLDVLTGLSQNTILSIVQDSSGFMWFATMDGLNKFDGYNFEIFYPSFYKQNTLKTNTINSVFTTEKNILWFASSNGGVGNINLFNHKIKNYFNEQISSSTAIIDDISGTIWIGTEKNGIFKYDKIQDKFIRKFNIKNSVLNSDFIVNISKTSNNLLLVATQKSIFILNPAKESLSVLINDISEITSNKQSIINTIYIDQDQKLWIGLINDGLVSFNLYTFEHNLYNFEKFDKKSNYIFQIFEYNLNTIWIATGKGLFVLDKKRDELFTFNFYYPNSDNIGNDNITNLYRNESDIIWLGTQNSGIIKLVVDNSLFKSLRFTNYSNEFVNPVFAIYQDTDSKFWISADQNIYKCEDLFSSPKIFNYSNKLPTFIRGLTRWDEDSFVIASRKEGLNIYNSKTQKIKRLFANDERFSVVRSVGKIDSNLWVGSELGGLYIINSKLNKVINEIHVSRVTYFLTEEQFVWVGTRTGLLKIKKQNYELIEKIDFSSPTNSSIAANNIYALHQCKKDKDVLWIASNGGLVKYNKKSKKFILYDISKGLPNNVVYGILEDKNGLLWLSTNRGLCNFHPKNETVKIFNITSGLQGFEYNYNSFYQSKEGYFLFGGVDGLNFFHPDSINYKSENIPILITNLHYPGKDITESIPAYFLNELNLYDSEDYLTIEFSSLDYRYLKGASYAYKMEGFDSEWKYTTNFNQVTYTNLPFGSYTFQVVSLNLDNTFSENKTSLNIIVHPPFFLKWWALTIYFFLFLLTIYIGFTFKLKKKIKELEKERIYLDKLYKADKIKSEFLARMSHEIRTPINTIISYVDMLKFEYEEVFDDYAYKLIDVIDNGGRRLIRTVDLILNVSDIQLDNYKRIEEEFYLYNDVLEPICFELLSLANSKELKIEINNVNNENILIKTDKFSVTQILTNLIENSIKFTDAGKVTINYIVENSKHIIEVIDTGIGISNDFLDRIYETFTQEHEGYARKYEGLGLGMYLVKRYCEINNINITIESEKNKGTKIILIFNN